jgi:hypothetical protein
MSFAIALLLAQGVVRVGPPERVLPPSNTAATFDLFKRVCVDPFPDPAGFAAAIQAEPGLARWQPTTQVEQLIPGKTWHSPTLTVQYWDRSANLPPPQCQVLAIAPGGSDAEQLFPRLASALGLGSGRISGKKRFRTAMWDLDRPDGTRWRVIFGTELRGDRLQLKLSMLNLGSRS